MEKEKFRKLIQDQYIVLDTNILIKALGNLEPFKELFQFLRNSNCDRVNFELVNFEFTRNDFLPELKKIKEEFISKINFTNLPYTPDLLKQAIKIARVYSHQGIQKGQISLVDCCIGALLKQYNKKLFLATLNHSDFPTALFDREYIWPIDAKNNIFTVAFYRFNSKKWQALKKKLEGINL